MRPVRTLLALAALCATSAAGMVVNGIGNRQYRCPPKFIRSGNSCYYISSHMATWHDAQFKCRDMRGSELAVLDRKWEDRNMRTMLNRNEVARLERWIGGIFDWYQGNWLWGNSGKKLRYQGFSRRKPGDDYRWKCIVMDPKMLYRWGSRSCIERKHFICETPLQVLDRKRKPKRKRMEKDKKNKRKGKPRKPTPIETNSTL